MSKSTPGIVYIAQRQPLNVFVLLINERSQLIINKT